jgi:hypothetical protein
LRDLRFSSGRRRTTWSRVAISPSGSPGPGEDFGSGRAEAALGIERTQLVTPG